MTAKYKTIKITNIEDYHTIDSLYDQLLNQKYQFLILHSNYEKYVLTKEKSLIKIDSEKQFLDNFNKDIYYKTIVKNKKITISEQDFNIYNNYISQFKNKLMKKKYNGKYYFGCIAVKTNYGFITTIRGKQNLDDYTIIESVDHDNHIINAINKKATLNAPLLDYLFKNDNVKAIVHVHEFDDHLPYCYYAFPGTVKDSIRDNHKSFNIMYHGVIYLFDKKGNIL